MKKFGCSGARFNLSTSNSTQKLWFIATILLSIFLIILIIFLLRVI